MIEVNTDDLRFLGKLILIWTIWNDNFDLLPSIEEMVMARRLTSEIEDEIAETNREGVNMR